MFKSYDDYKNYLKEILISEEQLQTRIRELGAEITKDYEDKDLLMICILRGGVLFLTDLMRNVKTLHEIEFMAISSYGVGARQSSGNVRINYDITTSITGRNVLLVEDIIDSGHTVSNVLEMLEARKPASLKVCTLLDKAARRETHVPIHYRGFDIADKFVFGYGLDLDEYYRELPFIGVVDTTKYNTPD